ncbi:homeobox-like protein HDP1 [Mercenaria mercenaria]|uniref:homeobox-like protein HDP1 n=1 Tax=Mercenaria mercenaria TaxID=6596 RepID=UPI00234E54D5|nr:homeobox-like protein HDP1 [Mercenaria mercenaria]
MKGLDGAFTAVNQTRTPIDVSLAEDLTYGCSSGLLCNISYVFSIKARNSNGTSEDNSTLLISAATKGIVQPQLIVEAANISNVSVSWTEVEKATGYMVAWCRNKNGECENRNIVKWQRFSSATRKAVIQINPENSPQDFLYGVSVLTEQGSSGLEWQDCVYLKNAYPKREPQNVVVSTGPDDNTLVVTWDKLTCKSDEPYIAMYNVQYNKLHDGNQQSQNVSASGEARIVLNNLEEKQTYIVTVRGVTKDGHYGPKSQSQKGIPVDKSLKPGAIVGISISVLLVVILAAVGCFCVLRKCKRKADKTKERLAQITIPDDIPFGPDGTVEEGGIDRSSTRSINSIERQTSNDSGFDPMTPPVGKFDEQPKFSDVSGLKNPRVLPNGYCTATFEKGQSSDTDPGSHAVELGSLHTSLDNSGFVLTEPVVAQVGFVMNGNNVTGSETFVKKVDRNIVLDETAVKARVKNDSGDSGVSDAYSKAALGRSEEKKNNDNGQDVDDKNSNSDNEQPDYVSGDKVINSSFKTSSNTIPKPLAFSECSFGNSSFSDRENDNTTSHVTDTSFGSSPDYVKAQSPHDNVNAFLSPGYITAQSPTISTNINTDNHQVSLPEQEIQNKSNEDNESNSEKILANASFQPLTNIPCPRSMDESHDSSIEEESASSPTHADASSPVKSGTSRSDYIKVTNNSTPMIHIPSNSSKSVSQPVNENGQASGYVTTTDMPNISVKCAPQQQANSGTSYVTLPNTGTPVSERTHGIQVQMSCVNPHQKPDDAHVSVSESQTSKQNSDVSLGYVTSVTSPNTSHLTQSSLNSSPVSFTGSNYFSEDPNIKIPTPASDQTNMTLPSVHNRMSSNVVTDNHAAGGYTSHSAVAQVPVPASSAPVSITSGGYLPHLNPVQGQMSPGVAAAQSAMYSPNVQNHSIAIKSQMFDSTVANNISSCKGEHEQDLAYPSASKTIDSTSSANSGYVLSENNSVPKSTDQTSSGYETNTDSRATFSSAASDDNDVNPQYRLTTAQKTDSQLKESYTGSDCTGRSLSSESGMVPFINDQPKENIPDSNTNKTNESQRPNSVPTSERQLPNGYVDHQFIPRGNYYKEQPSVEMRNIEKQNDEDDQGSKRGSDSGLSSLENESPETNRKLQNVQTGYVSCEVAKSMQK